jgi:hypothetical protein
VCAIIPGAFFLVGAVLLAIRAFSGGSNGLLTPGDPAHAFISLLFALGLFGLGYYIGNNNRCPKCKKWNGLEEKEKYEGQMIFPLTLC